jgi:CheY-like chemotaxis protein
MPALNVLLVEDDSDIRDVLAEAFGYAGCDAHLARHGQEALDLIRSGLRPDVIVLDLIMPVMDGFTFLSHKRKTRELARVPVIVVSATARGAIEGVSCVLRKPVEFAELLGAVRRCSV